MSHLKNFLIDQINKKEIEMAQGENELKKFQEQEKIFGLDENSNLLLQNLINAESELYNKKAEFNILAEREKYIRSQLTDEEEKLSESVTNNINERLYAIKNEIAIKEAELISAISQQGDGHPVVKDLNIKLKKLKSSLESETRTLISQGISVADPIKYRQNLMDSLISINALSATIETQINELHNLVKEYELDLELMPEKYLKFSRLTRDLNVDSETYSLMRQKLEEAKINEASQIGKVRVIDTAIPILKKVKPNKRIILILGLLVGLSIAVLIIFTIEYFDYTVKSIDELDSRKLSILTIVPAIGNHNSDGKKTKKYQTKLGSAEKIQRRLITQEDPKSPVSESYRTLRTSLMYSGHKKKGDGNILLISSPGPGEGKTTTIVNLAITYANLGMKTILIDTDLRKPVVHKIFSLNRDIGITSYVSGIENEYRNIINKTEVENLDVIASGVIPPNPSEMLASVQMKDLLVNLKKEYDIILMDSPPLLAVTDTMVCMKNANQFVLVVRSGKTEKGGLDRSLDMLEIASAPMAGVVMNAVDESTSY